MKITLPLSSFSSHGCSAVAIYDNGNITFSGDCSHCSASRSRNKPLYLYTYSAISTLVSIALDSNSYLIRRYKATVTYDSNPCSRCGEEIDNNKQYLGHPSFPTLCESCYIITRADKEHDSGEYLPNR